MPHELTVIENNMLRPLAPRFDAMLGDMMPANRLIQTILFSFEKTPKLLNCTRQSIINAAMTFAALRLPVDGATGQGFMIPFADVAQPVIGYKGYNTMGARSGITITGDVVREGDLEWDYLKGTGGFVRHKAKLDNPGRIIAAWALAESRDRPAGIEVLGIGDLLAVKAKSPGARKADSPWNDVQIGFPAMCTKTVKRRLSRILPFEVDDGRYQMGARVDEAFDEQGKHSYIDDKRNVIVEGSIAPREPGQPPTAEALMAPRGDRPVELLYADGLKAAQAGMGKFHQWWHALPQREAKTIAPKLEELKEAARNAEGQ